MIKQYAKQERPTSLSYMIKIQKFSSTPIPRKIACDFSVLLFLF